LNKANGPLEAFGPSVEGKFARNGESSTVNDGEVVAEPSPFRKIVLLVRLSNVASKVRDEPFVPLSLVFVRAMLTESALAAVAINRIPNATIAKPEAQYLFVFIVNNSLFLYYCNATLRKVSDQLPLSVPAAYVPLIFNGAVVAPAETAEPGNLRVTVVLAPGARFVILAGADDKAAVPNVVPFNVTCAKSTVTLPWFVKLILPTIEPFFCRLNSEAGEPANVTKNEDAFFTSAWNPDGGML
jgi:hypothetical protein